MYDYLISEYIKTLTTSDILDYARKKNIDMKECDAIILLSYAKKHYKTFLNGDPTSILKELKNKIEPNIYKEAFKLYIEYKLKYLK